MGRRFDWTHPVDGSDPATEWNGVHGVEDKRHALSSRAPAKPTPSHELLDACGPRGLTAYVVHGGTLTVATASRAMLRERVAVTPLAPRPFGRTGLSISPLGLGAGEIGDPALDDGEVEALLRAAVELGVTLIDTARSYGRSEERIGRFVGRLLRPVRDHVVLSTKVGYGVDGVPDWTGECVRLGVDRALVRLATDRIDIVHLHSCPVDVLARGDVVDALAGARRAGKIRCAAYSGDNDALEWAAASGRFDSLQLSWSLCDQRAAEVIERAHAAGVGVIAKRPLANAPWRFAERPVGHEAEPSWVRWRELADDPSFGPGELAWDELAARFAAHHPGVSSAIVGTCRLAHLRRNAELVARGALPDATVAAVRARWQAVGAGWPARI